MILTVIFVIKMFENTCCFRTPDYQGYIFRCHFYQIFFFFFNQIFCMKLLIAKYFPVIKSFASELFQCSVRMRLKCYNFYNIVQYCRWTSFSDNPIQMIIPNIANSPNGIISATHSLVLISRGQRCVATLHRKFLSYLESYLTLQILALI